jgi:pectin methylesterase-like acyl-CoA thioesterase/pectate lyase
VTAEVPYYYYVIAKSSTNSSAASDTVWAVASAGHTGTYVYEDEATEIFITKKSYDTVFNNKAVLEGIVYGAGTLNVEVNGSVADSVSTSVGSAFSFEFSLNEGRNDVNLLFTDADGKVTRKTYNFVYLTNYDYVVDQSFTGADGEKNTDGIPTYTTVQAAVNAAQSAGSADRQVILVLAGEYEERLEVKGANISIIGQDRDSTLIHYYPGKLGSSYEAGGDMDKRCAAYIYNTAKGFSAENISFKNDYVYSTSDGKSNKSADALRCDADGAVFVNTKFSSVQDTLYMNEGNQYYYKCRIEGLIDYIYSGEKARSFFNDCELVFVYESTKNSGYVCAPKTAADAAYGLTFYNCVITGEEGCNGNGYLLARPWGANAYITWINCYMGKSVYATLPYSDMSGNAYTAARFYEYGSYGPGYVINAARRQISPSKAADMISSSYLGWNPEATTATISSGSYIGTVKTTVSDGTVEKTPNDDKYLETDGDDTGLAMYDMEGYSTAYSTSGVTGGGLLKETSDNYYKVGTAEEFLTALTKVKESGKASVIELTADINLGCNEVTGFDSYSDIIKAYAYQALTHPTLKKTGTSVLTFNNMYNLTIFSQNGSSIKHANITMKNSGNIIIRNIKFDELWEWDEETTGDYDRNDWDYMTIDSGSDGIWIDHCTFYKAYDGVIDVKNPSPEENVTISWCEFLPGSENNTFFNEMMNTMAANPENYPYYNSLLKAGMSEEQIWWYAYGQKKTHLLGQSDTSDNAVGIHVTLANNYYKNSMDRMPRLRFGTAHVYNCIMDAQELLDAKDGITNADAAKHIVSNGASSTCDATVLLENCYINGIQNALNSGNGSSPSGYINAINSSYYMYGEEETLEPKCNTTKEGEEVKVTDADAFISALPYSGYHLYDSETLDQIVIPYAGAGKLDLTVLQWEKTAYNAAYTEPEVTKKETTLIPQEGEENVIPADVFTEDVKKATGCATAEELVAYLKNDLTAGDKVQSILPGIKVSDTYVTDITITVKVKDDNGEHYEPVSESTFPKEGIDIIISYPNGTDKDNYDFVVSHLIVNGWNGQKSGDIEYPTVTKTSVGLKVHIYSTSPFAIGWKQIDKTEQTPSDPVADDNKTPSDTIVDDNKEPDAAVSDSRTQDDDDDDDDTADTVTGSVITAPSSVSGSTAKKNSSKSDNKTAVVDATPTIVPSDNKTQDTAGQTETTVTENAAEKTVENAVEDALSPEVGAAVERADSTSIIIVVVAAIVVLLALLAILLYRKKKGTSEGV